MRTVYIHCDGGIGRRYNSLVSGICVANALEWNYVISWPINDQCACPLEDLFEEKFSQSVINPNTISDLTYYAQWNINDSNTNPFEFKTLEDIVSHARTADKDIFYCSFNIPPWAFKLDIYKTIKSKLQFKSIIYKRAEEFITKHKLTEYYGLQLRGTDHTTKLDEDFFYNLIRHNKKQRFFICSDEQHLETKFAELSNVVVYLKRQWVVKIDPERDWDGGLNLHRSKISILDAAVDLLILSRSEILNTNINSNFLKLAVILNGYDNYIREGYPSELRLGMRVTTANTPEQQQQIFGQ